MKKLLLIFLVFLLAGCKKEITYTWKGTLYLDCNQTPLVNEKVVAWQEVTGGFGPTTGGELASTETDSLGKFELTFEDDNGGSASLIAGVGLQRIPIENVGLGNVYANNRGAIDIFLEVENSYTSNDTLILFNNGLEIIGPFSSGLVSTIEEIQWQFYYDLSITEGEKYPIVWGINPNSTGEWNEEKIEISGCETRDEVIIKIR